MFSATRLRSKRELEVPIGVIYPISRLLIIRIDVRKPADATSLNGLQVDAVLVQEIIVGLRHDEPSKKIFFPQPPFEDMAVAVTEESAHLFAGDGRDGIGTVRLNALVSH